MLASIVLPSMLEEGRKCVLQDAINIHKGRMGKVADTVAAEPEEVTSREENS